MECPVSPLFSTSELSKVAQISEKVSRCFIMFYSFLLKNVSDLSAIKTFLKFLLSEPQNNNFTAIKNRSFKVSL